jgi:hypothetical protein
MALTLSGFVCWCRWWADSHALWPSPSSLVGDQRVDQPRTRQYSPRGRAEQSRTVRAYSRGFGLAGYGLRVLHSLARPVKEEGCGEEAAYILLARDNGQEKNVWWYCDSRHSIIEKKSFCLMILQSPQHHGGFCFNNTTTVAAVSSKQTQEFVLCGMYAMWNFGNLVTVLLRSVWRYRGGRRGIVMQFTIIPRYH